MVAMGRSDVKVRCQGQMLRSYVKVHEHNLRLTGGYDCL